MNNSKNQYEMVDLDASEINLTDNFTSLVKESEKLTIDVTSDKVVSHERYKSSNSQAPLKGVSKS